MRQGHGGENVGVFWVHLLGWILEVEASGGYGWNEADEEMKKM